MEAPYEIWLWLAKRFLKRRCLKSVEEGRWRTDNGACLYYKLTYEPKGSGELKKECKEKNICTWKLLDMVKQESIVGTLEDNYLASFCKPCDPNIYSAPLNP